MNTQNSSWISALDRDAKTWGPSPVIMQTASGASYRIEMSGDDYQAWQNADSLGKHFNGTVRANFNVVPA